MEEFLSIENILDSEQIENLFEEDTPKETSTDDGGNKTTEVEDVDNLFTKKPESVGSEEKEETKEKEDTESTKDNGASPKNNFYSSIAVALKDEGIFPDLEDDEVLNIKEPEDFAEAIEKQIQARFDERQKRIDAALNAGVEDSEIRGYERTLEYLDSLDDEKIEGVDENSETLRKQLIYQDFINRGYSEARAQREVQKSFNAGSDVEDAKEALASNKDFFQRRYDNIIKEAQKEVEREKEERKAQAIQLRKSILEEDIAFGDVKLSKAERQKVYDLISKPVYKDPETGDMYTALQKYQLENKTEFLKNVGLLYTLTDGFKNIDSLVKTKVKKTVKEGLRNLEQTINSTARHSDGSLKYVSSVKEDPESVWSKGWNLGN